MDDPRLASDLRYHLHMRRLALLLVLSISAFAQVRPAEDGTLSLRVILNAQSIKPADTLLMKAEVMNIGNDVVLFRTDDLCLNPGAGLTMTVIDASGREVKTPVLLTCVPQPNLSERDRFVHLAPDNFYGRLIHIMGNRIAPKPGVYKLSFTLRATADRQRVTRIFNADTTSTVAFTSESRALTFEIPIQITP